VNYCHKQVAIIQTMLSLKFTFTLRRVRSLCLRTTIRAEGIASRNNPYSRKQCLCYLIELVSWQNVRRRNKENEWLQSIDWLPLQAYNKICRWGLNSTDLIKKITFSDARPCRWLKNSVGCLRKCTLRAVLSILGRKLRWQTKYKPRDRNSETGEMANPYNVIVTSGAQCSF
jgi:hypothetical protein